MKAEISASAVRANVSVLRGCVGPDVKLCAAVKCDCYGHGRDMLLPTIAESVDWLAVATADEALALREADYAGPALMFFNTCGRGDGDMLDKLLARRITLTVTSLEQLEALAGAAGRTGQDARLHVMVDTGMNRSGVHADGAPLLLDGVRIEPHLRMTGIYTHLATADEADKTPAREQLGRFDETLSACGVTDGGIMRHAANSAAAIDLPESHYDMVRAGIAIYGYQPSDRMHNRLPLRPALRLSGRLMQVKSVPAAARCGYGLTHEFARDSIIGLVPIGYGDGYMRNLGNRATMRIGGRDVPVRGRISMDQTIVDLTDLPSARVGDEVEIISPEPDAPNSVENLARLAGTVPYEIVTRLGPRVRRVLVE